MSTETLADLRSSRVRADEPALVPLVQRLGPWLSLAILASGFVLVGGGNLELGPIEAKLALSASEETVGPYGQVYGGWEPSIWPAQVAPSVLWAWGEGGFPTAASVRWPSALAGIVTGLLLARRLMPRLGARAGVLFGLCWFGSVALIDRSAGAGIELIGGLATVAALDRILGKGSDLVAGLWAALAFLAGGWPPVALIILSTVVIGRIGASLSLRLLVPPLVAAVVWSGWALSGDQPAEAWGAALALPLTQRPAWLLALGVIGLGLPWSPFAALAASRSVRDGWDAPGRALVLGWLQVAGASLLAGTAVPGFANAARIPALAGLAVVAAACLDRIWAGSTETGAGGRKPRFAWLVQTGALWGAVALGAVAYLASWDTRHPGLWILPTFLALPLGGLAVTSFAQAGPRRAFLSLAAQLVGAWVVLTLAGGIWLAGAVAYYRGLAIVLIGLSLVVGAVASASVIRGDARRGLLALVVLAVCLKIGHWGYYVPEWNYRRSQGPWGRAIGQWVWPRWTIYTTHAWPPDLAFATGRPFRQLADPRLLAYQGQADPKFVLLLENEWEFWPQDAPPLTKLARFQDERGQTRVVARTGGAVSWNRIARTARDE